MVTCLLDNGLNGIKAIAREKYQCDVQKGKEKWESVHENYDILYENRGINIKVSLREFINQSYRAEEVRNETLLSSGVS
jgi:hypothetical protein